MRLALLAALSFAGLHAQTSWQVVWSDEFNGPAGALPDPTKWTYDLGDGGWGNNELETYTKSNQNVYQDGNGNLVIHVKSDLTSARIKTQDLFTFTYGKVEARIKIPSGQGIWPAFWMLGANIETLGWPQCGEIDIMENVGKEPGIVHGTVHGPSPSGATNVGAPYSLASGQDFADDFHIYAIIWSPGSVQFFVDGSLYFTVTPASYQPGAPWVFNTPFFLLLNVAVGGYWPGNPDATTQFPQDMTVDYVRVSQAVPAVQAVVNAASFGTAMAPGSLATIFGSNLADVQNANLFDSAHGVFLNNSQGTQVLVGGRASALTYADSGQINFQIPWEIPAGAAVPIQVVRDGIAGNAINVPLLAAAPAAFLNHGIAILSCNGSACTLWGNGFGPTEPAQQDGAPDSSGAANLASGACQLTVGNVPAAVTYCGAAPGLVIDQLNFTYPQVGTSGTTVPATLSVGGASTSIMFPPP